MQIGVIGLNANGQLVIDSLLSKTDESIYVYDAEGRTCPKNVTVCETAVQLCEKCDLIITALHTPAELANLFEQLSSSIRKGQVWIDLTEISPALAHKIASGMAARQANYLDCGIFGRNGLAQPFIMFVGGANNVFAAVQPFLLCFAQECYYMGPSGRGQAMRIFCRSMSGRILDCLEDTSELAQAFGIERSYFFSTLGRFHQIADPLGELGGGRPGFFRKELENDVQMAKQMQDLALHKPDA